jgi:hypothetical protein
VSELLTAVSFGRLPVIERVGCAPSSGGGSVWAFASVFFVATAFGRSALDPGARLRRPKGAFLIPDMSNAPLGVVSIQVEYIQ